MLRKPTNPSPNFKPAPIEETPAVDVPNEESLKPKHNRLQRLKPLLWQGKFLPAFWTTASVISLVVNLILILVIILVGRQLFAIKSLVQDGLIGGLYTNFTLMDQAHIKTTIQVQDTIKVEDNIPINFTLPLQQDTDVVLTRDTPIPNTAVVLNGVPIYTTVTLPKGTTLNISLNLEVPVNQTVPVVLNVPVNLTVPVDIPLEETQLHQPFVGLQSVVSPYKNVLGALPNSWEATPLCGKATNWLCQWLFDMK